MGFFSGSEGKFNQRSTLGPEQQQLYQQLQQALQGSGAGGAYGDIADYYRSLLEDDNDTYNSFAAPEQRKFNEQIIPGLSEQFAGMGAGGLNSSGFRNAAVGAGADLSERLGQLRAQIRQQGVQGLQGLANQGLGNYNQTTYQERTPGFLESAAPGIGSGIGSILGSALGPVGTAVGGAVGNLAGQGAGYIGNMFKRSKPQQQDVSYGQAGAYPTYGNYNPTGA